MNERIESIVGKGKDWYHTLARREQVIVVGGMLVLVVLLLQVMVIDPVASYLQAQREELELVRKDMQALPHVLARYQRLVRRQDNIEKLYQKIELSEGAFAHLEDLVKNKAGIPAASFDIKEDMPIKFGNQYEQIPYRIRFKITDYPRLIDFLQEVVHGSKPLIISTIDMRKSRLGDHIQVDMQVNGVRRVG